MPSPALQGFSYYYEAQKFLVAHCSVLERSCPHLMFSGGPVLLDIIVDTVLVVVGSLIVLLILFVALPGLVLCVFRWWRVSRNEEDAPRSH